MQAVLELEKLGYVFTYKEDDLSYKCEKVVLSDYSRVGSLLEQVRKNKGDAVTFLRQRTFDQLELKLKYNQLLAREQAGEKYLDDRARTPEEAEKWTPLFQEILRQLNELLDQIGTHTGDESVNGFNIVGYLGDEVGLDELPDEWRCACDRNQIA